MNNTLTEESKRVTESLDPKELQRSHRQVLCTLMVSAYQLAANLKQQNDFPVLQAWSKQIGLVAEELLSKSVER